MSRPPLYGALAAAHPTLLSISNGFRLLSMILAASMIVHWAPSVWRCLRDRQREGDAHRAGWVPLALATLTFEARWFLPIGSDLARGQMLIAAHGGLAFALLFAIWVHGRRAGHLRIRRALLMHGGALALCIAISTVLR